MDLREMFPMKLGFGGLRLPIKNSKDNIDYSRMCEMVDEFVSAGGKYFDTSYIYHKGESERAFGACVVDRLSRESFCLADKLPLWNVFGDMDLNRIFDKQLEKTHVDYFDFYLLHNVNNNSMDFVEKSDAFEFQQKLKRDGKIRFAGFSFHDSPELLDKILTEHRGIDFVQLQINYYDWLSEYIQSKKCYEIAASHDIPVIVMETVRGGGLIKLPKAAGELIAIAQSNSVANKAQYNEADSIQCDISPASLAIRFAASLDNVMMVLSGMSDISQIKDNCSFMQSDKFKKLTDAEYEIIGQVRNILNMNASIKCSKCGKCVNVCPQNIEIAKAFEIYNDAVLFGNNNFPSMHYNIHIREHSAGSCTACNRCMSLCPENIDIVKMLAIISNIYDSKK